METVFDSTHLPREERFRAWREQICQIYVNSDVETDDPLNYRVQVREAQFGGMTLTESIGNSLVVHRRPSHFSDADKDCFYLHFVTDGMLHVDQAGIASTSHMGAGRLVSSAEPYDLIFPTNFRCFFIEIPRAQLEARFSSKHPLEPGKLLPTGSSLGRIAMEFCNQLALEGSGLDDVTKAKLGEQAIDLFALALDGRTEVSDHSIQQVRLQSIKAFIERNLGNPALTPARIASRNDISLSYLHHLFKSSGHSVFEWVWLRRLERCYQMIAAPQHRHRSITEIAEAMGFSNPSHFSNLFRKKFGIRPSDLRRLHAFEPDRISGRAEARSYADDEAPCGCEGYH